MISYGAGVKIVPKITETSKCFAFSKNLFNPVHNDFPTWLSDYENFVNSAEFALPADQKGFYEQLRDFNKILNPFEGFSSAN